MVKFNEGDGEEKSCDLEHVLWDSEPSPAMFVGHVVLWVLTLILVLT